MSEIFQIFCNTYRRIYVHRKRPFLRITRLVIYTTINSNDRPTFRRL